MKRRKFIAVGFVALAALVFAIAASGVSGATKAKSITVWLQVDAQSGWPDVVAAANSQFQNAHPGVGVNVQYQGWPTHLQKFDATLAGGNTPDVIEMGNTEMTKYMAAGAFQDLTADKSSFANSATWLAGLAASGRYNGHVYGVPYYAGSRVVTYRTDLFKKAGIKVPTTLAQYTADAKKLNAKFGKQGFSPVYIAGEDWYVAMGFVFDYGGNIATRISGKWKGALNSPKSVAGLTAFKNFFNAASHGSKTTIETQPNPYDVFAQGNAASMIGPTWFTCCVKPYTSVAGQFVMPSHTKGQVMPGLPRRLGPGGPGRGRQGARRGLDPRLHEQLLREVARGEGQHPEHDQPVQRDEDQRAGCSAELVRPDREALGRRRDRQRPAHDAVRDPDEQVLGQAGRHVRERQHRLHAEPVVSENQAGT